MGCSVFHAESWIRWRCNTNWRPNWESNRSEPLFRGCLLITKFELQDGNRRFWPTSISLTLFCNSFGIFSWEPLFHSCSKILSRASNVYLCVTQTYNKSGCTWNHAQGTLLDWRYNNVSAQRLKYACSLTLALRAYLQWHRVDFEHQGYTCRDK